MMSSHSNNLIFFGGGGKMHILPLQSLFFFWGGGSCPPLLASMHCGVLNLEGGDCCLVHNPLLRRQPLQTAQKWFGVRPSPASAKQVKQPEMRCCRACCWCAMNLQSQSKPQPDMTNTILMSLGLLEHPAVW